MQAEFAYAELNIAEIRKELERRLPRERFEHSCRTAEIAVHFAGVVGYDEGKAELAALMHDIAREFTQEQNDEAANKYGITLGRYNHDFPPSVHCKIGAAIAQREFGITDGEILAAIRNHVSGRPCMKTLEKIIYVADHLDRLRIVMPEKQAFLMTQSLDEALYWLLGMVIKYDAKHKKTVDERTQQTFDWLLDVIRNKAKTGMLDLNEEVLKILYSRLDGLIKLYSEHALLGFPAENFRDLGGYRSADGRTVRKHKILRSASLDGFTPADYEKLAEMGVNYVVDLRSASEKSGKPQLGSSRVKYIELPFEMNDEYKPYLETLSEWIDESDDPEETAWLIEKYFECFDLDGMYMKLLLAPDSREKFRKILEIMLGGDCTGILIFCRSGKDRTGIAISAIMNALGIDKNAAIDDYLISKVPYYGITLHFLTKLRKSGYNLEAQRRVAAVLGVDSERVMLLNRMILSQFGEYGKYFSAESFLGAAELEHFRDKYLE